MFFTRGFVVVYDYIAAQLATLTTYIDNQDAAQATYTDEQIALLTTYVDEQVAGAGAAMSEYTNEDSESQILVPVHAYLAQSDGFVSCTATLAQFKYLTGYVGDTNNPPGTGVRVAYTKSNSASQSFTIFFAVKSGKYFEITSNGTGVTMYWKSIGDLVKPIDQD